MKYAIPLLGILWATITTQLAHADANVKPFIMETSPEIALTHARLIDGTGAPTKEDYTVIVRNGRIVDIGPDSTVPIPNSAKTISLKGKSLLPGWISTHEHLMYPMGWGDDEGLAYVFQPSHARIQLAFGITSLRTTASIKRNAELELGLKRAIESGEEIGPDYDLTSPVISGPHGSNYQRWHNIDVADTPEKARALVRRYAEQGFTSFKVHETISRASLGALIDEAHKLGRKVTGHLCSITYREAADLGIDSFAHPFALATDFFPDKRPDVCPRDLPVTIEVGDNFIPSQDFIGIENYLAMIQQNNENLARMGVDNSEIQSLYHDLIEHDVSMTWTMGKLRNRVPPDYVTALFGDKALEVIGAKNTDGFDLNVETQPIEVGFWRAGGRLTLGTDTQIQFPTGYAHLTVIEKVVHQGIPPLEAIKIATLNGAEDLGVDDDRGSIEVGKRADLIVINGDPSTNIADIHNIEMVFKNGIGYDSMAILKASAGTIGRTRPTQLAGGTASD